MAASLQRVRTYLVRTLEMILLSSPGVFGFLYTLCLVDLLHIKERGTIYFNTVVFFHNFSLSVGNGLMRTNSLFPLL